jgi:hypothetical protein
LTLNPLAPKLSASFTQIYASQLNPQYSFILRFLLESNYIVGAVVPDKVHNIALLEDSGREFLRGEYKPAVTGKGNYSFVSAGGDKGLKKRGGNSLKKDYKIIINNLELKI